MLVNGGAPGAGSAEWRAASRATASHNTLCLGEKSSSKLIRHKTLAGLVGGSPIRHPDDVHASIYALDDGVEVKTSHDGYMKRFGLMHHRTLALNGSGRRLLGIDRLEGKHDSMRLSQDIPFAIHFHLHPAVRCRRGDNPNLAIIELASGAVWWFSLEGARLAIEESTYFADSAGPPPRITTRCARSHRRRSRNSLGARSPDLTSPMTQAKEDQQGHDHDERSQSSDPPRPDFALGQNGPRSARAVVGGMEHIADLHWRHGREAQRHRLRRRRRVRGDGLSGGSSTAA